ncbi:MAG: heme-binding domain-containing protein, partial [Bryobacteraceae bacterium]
SCLTHSNLQNLTNTTTYFVSGRSWAWLGVVVAILIVYSSTVHPFGSVKQPHGPGVSINALSMSPGVKASLQRSCQKCRSNQTVWPWYSYVAPVSWLIERDVRGGAIT